MQGTQQSPKSPPTFGLDICERVSNAFEQTVKHPLIHPRRLHTPSIRLDRQGLRRELLSQYPSHNLGVDSRPAPLVVRNRKAGPKGQDEVLSGLLWHE